MRAHLQTSAPVRVRWASKTDATLASALNRRERIDSVCKNFARLAAHDRLRLGTSVSYRIKRCTQQIPCRTRRATSATPAWFGAKELHPCESAFSRITRMIFADPAQRVLFAGLVQRVVAHTRLRALERISRPAARAGERAENCRFGRRQHSIRSAPGSERH